MRRPANILFLAVLVGLLSATLVYRYLQAKEAELAAVRDKALGVAVDVVVASEAISIGSRIQAHQVRIARWPADSQPDNAMHDVSLAVGHIARSNVQKNQPLAEADLTTEASGLLPLIIGQGMRGMSVKVDNVTGVSGFITPNSRVDVLVAGSVEGQEQRSKLILQNVTVLATGTSIEQKDDKPVEVPTVTLLVSPEEAEKLTLATRQEPVRLALRNYRDEDEVQTPGTSTRDLFGLGGDTLRPQKGGPPPRPSVEILLGETRSRQAY